MQKNIAEDTSSGNDDGNDEAVDSQDSRHNHRNNRLHHQLRPHDAHGSNTHAALGSAIRSASTCAQQQDISG